jgi:ribosomal-protein-alanine N-acetyltransferase
MGRMPQPPSLSTGPLPKGTFQPRRLPAVGKRVKVETEHYSLHSLEPADATPVLQGWFRDDSILESMNVSPLAWSIPELQAFIGTFDNSTRFIIGIRAKPSSTLIGFYTVSINRRHRIAQFTAAVGDKAHWGKGVLTETTRALVEHMFTTRGVEKMYARVVSTNKRIIFNLANSTMFQLEGTLRQEILAPDGKRLDVLSFACLKPAR